MRFRFSHVISRGQVIFPWPYTFHAGTPVRLRDDARKFGIIVRAGEHQDEWVVSYRDGERDVYLLEHLEVHEPGPRDLRVIDYLRFIEFSRN